MNVHAIPDELKAEPRWVLWKLEERVNKDGTAKITKVPYQARRPGALASSTESATWSDFRTAVRVAALDARYGLGFVLGAGWVGIDLDKCRDAATNVKSEEAQALIDAAASYTEASPSGTGVHIILRGVIPGGCKVGGVELYAEGRYFTMTGLRLGVHDTVRERQDWLTALHAQMNPPPPPRKDGKPRKVSAPRVPKASPTSVTRAFPSSTQTGVTYITTVDARTGRRSCTCPGWKFRRFNKPCRHVAELAAALPVAR